mgnify:FL=1
MKFALMMEKKVIEGLNNHQIILKTQNTGIPDPEVILFVECWLEKMKDNMKSNIKTSIAFC